jgi:hypothetical protein
MRLPSRSSSEGSCTCSRRETAREAHHLRSRFDRAPDDVVRPSQGVTEVEASIELRLCEPARYLLVFAEEGAERSVAMEGPHGAPLHDLVRLLARKASRDEREHDALAEEEPARAIQISLHSLRVDD